MQIRAEKNGSRSCAFLQDFRVFLTNKKCSKIFFPFFLLKLKWTIQKFGNFWFWLILLPLGSAYFCEPGTGSLAQLAWCTLYLDWCRLNRRRNDNHFLTFLQSQAQQYSWVLHGLLQIISNQEIKGLPQAQN